MDIFQNDFNELPCVNSEGCLFMSLCDIVSEEMGRDFTHEEIQAIYTECNRMDYLGFSYSNRDKSGAFVLNHAGVLNTASKIAHTNYKWKYLARVYQSFEHDRGLTDYIADPKYWGNATAIIFQIQTKYGGHFRRMGYDPWKSGLKEQYLKSVRYYQRIA